MREEDVAGVQPLIPRSPRQLQAWRLEMDMASQVKEHRAVCAWQQEPKNFESCLLSTCTQHVSAQKNRKHAPTTKEFSYVSEEFSSVNHSLLLNELSTVLTKQCTISLVSLRPFLYLR